MIVVFTSSVDPVNAGHELTNQFHEWLKGWPKTVKVDVLDIHSNSNKYGWMLVVKYKLTDADSTMA